MVEPVAAVPDVESSGLVLSKRKKRKLMAEERKKVGGGGGALLPLGDSVRRLVLRVEYDGRLFAGSQKQVDARTVQEELEAGFKRLTGEECTAGSSSRTDAGVHALDNVFLIKTKVDAPLAAIVAGLNTRLPEDLVVARAAWAGEGFDPRKSASGKVYRYAIVTGVRQPMQQGRVWHIGKPLDIGAMKAAATFFQGTHNFAAFSAAEDRNPSCTIAAVDVNFRPFPGNEARAGIEVIVRGNRFLYRMVRIIVGTLVEIGMGTREVSAVQAALQDGAKRQLAGQTAPASGLTLAEVTYPAGLLTD